MIRIINVASIQTYKLTIVQSMGRNWTCHHSQVLVQTRLGHARMKMRLYVMVIAFGRRSVVGLWMIVVCYSL